MKCTSLLVPVNDQVSIVLEPPHGVHDQPRRATNVLQSRTVEFCAVEPADKRTIPEHKKRVAQPSEGRTCNKQTGSVEFDLACAQLLDPPIHKIVAEDDLDQSKAAARAKGPFNFTERGRLHFIRQHAEEER